MKSKKMIINHLIKLRKKYNLFSLDRCAYDVGVTMQTVRNFEKQVSINVDVMLYYISRILWDLDLYEYYLANDANVDREEVKRDRQTTIALLQTCYYDITFMTI